MGRPRSCLLHVSTWLSLHFGVLRSVDRRSVKQCPNRVSTSRCCKHSAVMFSLATKHVQEIVHTQNSVRYQSLRVSRCMWPWHCTTKHTG